MTEKEQLEKLKKEIQILSDQRHKLVQEIPEFEAKKKYAEISAKKAQERTAEIEKENEKSKNDCLEKMTAILASAEAKESQFTTKLQTLSQWEKELAQKEMDQEQKVLSLGLDSRMAELAKERKEFDAFIASKLAEADTILENAKRVADEKLAALSRENSRNQDLITQLEQQRLANNESRASMDETLEKLTSERSSLKESRIQLENVSARLQKELEELSLAQGKLKIAQEEADKRAEKLSTAEQEMHEKNVDLDLKRREVAALDKRVQKLIEVNRLEAEVKNYASNG